MAFCLCTALFFLPQSGTEPYFDTGGFSQAAQQLARHREISTARWLHENFFVPFLHILSPLDKALIEKPMFVQVGLFCTSNLSSARWDEKQKWWTFWLLSLCLSSFAVIMSEINPPDHKSITARHFLRDNKQVTGQLRLTFRSGEIMELADDLTNAIIACIMFGAWIWEIWKTSLKGFGTIRQKNTTLQFFIALINVPWREILQENDVNLLHRAACKEFVSLLCRKPSETCATAT